MPHALPLRRTRANGHNSPKLGPRLSPTMDDEATSYTPPHYVCTPPPEIPIEIISDEEMALIDAAFAAVSRTLLPPLATRGRSIHSIATLSKKRFSTISAVGSGSDSVGDIEDSARQMKKKSKANESLLQRFRTKKGLSVTDITATEWCEKQMEFVLHLGKAKPTKAMKAGSARHAALEEEVVKKVVVRVTSSEDKWALKFTNFIIGVNQLLFEGMTRELPLVSFEEGMWMVGIIDEIRMPTLETERYVTLVDTKTRVRPQPPAEPQQRNGRLQLMCYKRLWDNLAADKFPSGKFFDFFALNPNYMLSSDIRDCTYKSGFPAETLSDLVNFYKNTCSLLPPAHDKLLLRYELQEDQSLLGENRFDFEADWLDSQLKSCLEFWLGEREPSYTPEEERWKCRYCKFSSKCPVQTDNGHQAASPSSTTEEPSSRTEE